MREWIEIRGRERRRKIIRKKVSGSPERPRLAVHRSLKHIHAQVIDDATGNTLLSLSTASKDFKGKLKKDAGNVKGASLLGDALAAACKAKGISTVVFDRSGYLYHGRVKALADAARKGGLKF